MSEFGPQSFNRKKRARRNRIIKRWIITIAVVACSWWAWDYVHDPSFSFGTIKINGTRQLSEREILQISEQGTIVNIFNLNTSKIDHVLNHDPRFVRGESRFRFPNILEINVVERMPAIYVQDAQGHYVKIDYAGYVMSITKGVPDDSAPILMNEVVENINVGEVVKNQRILSTIKFMSGLTYEACQDFGQVRIDKYNNLEIILKNNTKFVVGILDEIGDRGKAFLSMYEEIKSKSIDVEYVDLRFNKPYLRMKEVKKN